MAITSFWREPRGPVLWRVHFTSDLPTPTFYVWVDGALFSTTTALYVDIPVGLGRYAQVEVFDDAGATPSPWFPASVTLRWEIAEGDALYRVEQWVDAEWVVRAQVPATGSGVGRWESAPMDDGAVHTFRVVPVDGTGRDGVAREFSGVMCRYPDAPVASVALSSGEFTIT